MYVTTYTGFVQEQTTIVVSPWCWVKAQRSGAPSAPHVQAHKGTVESGDERRVGSYAISDQESLWSAFYLGSI